MSDNAEHIDQFSQLLQAHEVWKGVLANVKPEQYDLPTVSDDWDVRILISHVIIGNRWAEGNIRNGTAPWVDEDVFGDGDPNVLYQQTFDSMLATFKEPAALERTFKTPFGELPTNLLVNMRFGDLLMHSWDLAKATGQNTDLAPELSEYTLAGMKQFFADPAMRGEQYKPEVPVPATASAADRLAGYMGKQV